MKKRKKRELVVFPVARGRNYRLDATRICQSYNNLGYLYPGALRGTDLVAAKQTGKTHII